MEKGVAVVSQEEIEKLVDTMRRMEQIIQTSPNQSQVDRVRKEFRKYAQKLATLMPGIDPDRVDLSRIQTGPGSSPAGSGNQLPPRPRPGANPSSGGTLDSGASGYSVFDRFPIAKASPNSTDPDVNMAATVLRIIQKEYWPALSDQYCKLDFSHGGERDAIRMKMDNVLRNLKVLTETIEEYAMAEKQDFREQLLKMKHRQSRVFLMEANTYFKDLVAFLAKLVQDIQSNGGVILNKEDILKFDTRYYEATALEGRRVAEALKEFHLYITEAIQRLRLPDLR